MGIPRPVLLATAVTAGGLLLVPLPASAVPGRDDSRPHHVRESGAPAAALPPAGRISAVTALAALGTPGPALRKDGGYPRRTVLEAPPENAADKSIKLGLAPYHALAPRLNALQKLGNRVSVEVAGRSAGGHELYLVTVTAPESAREAGEQERMRELIENSPAEAAKDRRIKSAYKTPVFINNNIHGNEWEGTDAALGLIEELAKAKDGRTKDLLAKNRIYLNVTSNPDGRIAGTRANANGFDLNRDFITASQPETRAVRQIAIDKQPAVMLDLHGYVNGTLIEPTTPPHGENYEYDLFLKNAYANALGMEKAVNDLGYTSAKDGVEPPVIPFRDQQEGWDDWPPIFTPQYMPFQGAVASHTVEFPMTVNNRSYDTLPAEELRRRAAINTDIAGAVMRATLDYTLDHRTSVIADQIETFRRGAAGEAQRPVSEKTVPGVPGIGPEDVYTASFPRAYVIPAGGAQRSATAAARLVDHLIANDVRVRQARAAFRFAGRSYPAGSYVVDMHQPKRGIANVILSEGRDISADVSTMYDISGWSLGLLWGASVDTVRKADSGPRFDGRTVLAASATGSVAAGRGDLRLRLDDPKELAALNSLLGQGVKVRRAADGAAVVPSSARRQAGVLADRYGVVFSATKEKGTTGLHRTRVAAAVTPGEQFALREMGFEVLPVSTATLNAGFDWTAADVLYVSSGLQYGALNPAARAALDGFLAGGAGLVTLGPTGAAFNTAAGLLAAEPVAGNGDANGVVRVANAGGAVTGGAPAHTFVYSPLWFTDLGPGVRTEQSYAIADPLVSGHWRAKSDGSGGPEDAAGKASIVSGTSAQGTPVVMFGTEPLFRDHPKGAFAQLGRALLSGSAG
ncbi:M14 family zinc carboxypeptidase [Streptomyces sp. AK02-01A]|uniref:M14 family zinc carboxypeptidase n=1 Tax=Streptomyces sp. AK02-01A TaxID=3028648 RepID=UPI0029A494EB|nr:M14 family zinc carboxypeptidase [Streptomyces sp. AK02-01A]MDX3849695.1 M14 family zinc carboxypeptidase [Streptomyces sp. AK02-01A]MDX3849735.1 M14 family zinc carboxypeptidase [Streptomyces sp. AK02-01A]